MDNDDFDLTVLPVKDQVPTQPLKRKVDPRLPDIKVGACVGLIARPRSGKSTLIVNLLANSNFYKDAFSEVYLIGGSLLSDKTIRPLLNEYRQTSWDFYSDQIVNDIIAYNMSFPEEERPNAALVIDDMIGLRGADKRGSAISRIASNYRHFGVKFLAFSTQKLSSIPRTIRCCMSDVILFRSDNIQERKLLAEQWGDSYGGEDSFIALLNYATKEPYNFLYLKLEAKKCPEAYRNFEELIYPTSNKEINDTSLNPNETIDETIQKVKIDDKL